MGIEPFKGRAVLYMVELYSGGAVLALSRVGVEPSRVEPRRAKCRMSRVKVGPFWGRAVLGGAARGLRHWTSRCCIAIGRENVDPAYKSAGKTSSRRNIEQGKRRTVIKINRGRVGPALN